MAHVEFAGMLEALWALEERRGGNNWFAYAVGHSDGEVGDGCARGSILPRRFVVTTDLSQVRLCPGEKAYPIADRFGDRHPDLDSLREPNREEKLALIGRVGGATTWAVAATKASLDGEVRS